MSIPTPERLQRQLLAEALQLSRQTQMGLDELSRQDRLKTLSQKLQQFAHPLNRDRLAAADIPMSVRQTFVMATLLLTRYPQVGGRHWQGSLASPTLASYQPDPMPPLLLADQAATQLIQQFELPTSFLEELAVGLDRVDHRIQRQRRIIQAVLAEVSHESELPRLAARQQLWQRLFGDVPLPVEAMDWIHTDMQIFFCLNYQQGQLFTCDDQGVVCFEVWNRLRPEDRDKLQPFLLGLERFSYGKFDRFPIFGPCDPGQFDGQWCDRLAQQTGYTSAEVRQTLAQSVSIIPTHKAEAFLVHDIWGHHWQFLLTEFASDYNLLGNCGEPLRSGETAYTPYGPLSCRELFEVRGQEVHLKEEQSRLFFGAEVQQRLGLLFTHLMGEMMADAAEFKFIWDYPQQAQHLQSSSVFANTPTKLDLSLADIDFLFLEVLRPLLEMSLSVFAETSLEMELLAEWGMAGHPIHSLELRTSLKQALARLYQIFLEEYNSAYLPTLKGEVGLFTKMVSNLLYLQNAINALYTDRIANSYSHLPFQDLLMVFMGSACARDSFAEFWAIDDLLAAYFLPCWQLLLDWLQPGICGADDQSASATQPQTAVRQD